MDAQISITLRYTFGGEAVIQCSPFDIVGTAMSENEIEIPLGTKMILCHKGKVLDENLTFDYQGVKDGDFIVCYLKKIELNNSKRQNVFMPIVVPVHRSRRRYQTLSQMKNEICSKITDQRFNGWEMSKDLPSILKRMRNQQADASDNQEVQQTIIPEAKLSTDPLPILPEETSRKFQGVRKVNSSEEALQNSNHPYMIAKKE